MTTSPKISIAFLQVCQLVSLFCHAAISVGCTTLSSSPQARRVLHPENPFLFALCLCMRGVCPTSVVSFLSLSLSLAPLVLSLVLSCLVPLAPFLVSLAFAIALSVVHVSLLSLVCLSLISLFFPSSSSYAPFFLFFFFSSSPSRSLLSLPFL